MSIKLFFAILTGKTVRLFCRLLHRGGTGKPGTLALKICPDLLSFLSKDVHCIVITGTNGKTTCMRIVEEGLRQDGFSCFANRSGANLIEGIATEFLVNSTLTGKCRYRYAVLETDEATTKRVCLQLQPDVILVTNLFRDQVDRFGGVVNTRDNIRIGIQNAPNAVLVLNADCPVTASLAEGVPNKTLFYGLSAQAAEQSPGKGVSDLEGCIRCGNAYDYGYIVYSHLGNWHCPSCGAGRPEAQFEVKEILQQTLAGSKVSVRTPASEDLTLDINLPAIYNVYNALGSYAALTEIGVHADASARALSEFQCVFGRMEKLKIGKKGGRMTLVKNDAGCNQVLQFLKQLKEPFVLAIYLNNNISDGVDISWLEQAEFEILRETSVKKIYVSGLRMEELYSRLLRADIPEAMIRKQKSCPQLISELNQSDDPVFIMPNYTGMIETRNEIVRQFGGSEFWND